MKKEKLNIEGLILIIPDIYRDERGIFIETYHKEKYKKILPLETNFVQDNMSFSTYGVIRGLHYQKAPYSQAKLVRCIMGCILDVSVDIRPKSSTYGRYCKIILSENNQYQLFVPKGFAHGFSVLSEKAIVEYKCDEFYHKECESGINYNDPYLSIDWEINNGNIIVSEKDSKLPFISNNLRRRSNDTCI